jgi:hypothetical protein
MPSLMALPLCECHARGVNHPACCLVSTPPLWIATLEESTTLHAL